MPLSLTRAVGFRATHRLYRADWSTAENRQRFGWTVESHGHEYRCEVTVTGPVDEELGVVIDLALLDRLLQEEVVARFGGKALHEDLPEFHRTLSTCESIARDVFRRIEPRLPAGVRLARVRLFEDPTLYAECTGDA